MPQRRVAVTGAAGFIGSHLCRALLQRGDRVLGIDNFDSFYDRTLKEANISSLACDHFQLVPADICDATAIREILARERPSLIVHLAALAGVRPSIESPLRYANVNVNGLTSILEAARACDCCEFLFASSSSVYGNSSKQGGFSETDRVDHPISPYAATKRAGELMCEAYTHLFRLRIALLRFFTVYGPAQRPDLAISKFMRLLIDEKPIPMFGDGTSSRDYTFIDDIITGVLAAGDWVRKAPTGTCRIFNLGGSQPITLSQMIESIARVAGRQPTINRLPMQPGDVERTCADLTRSHEELGFAPRTPFEEGLRQQWQWMQSMNTAMSCR